MCCVALTHTKLFRVDFGQNWNVIGQCAAVVHRRRVVTGSGGGGESGPIWNGKNALQTTQDLQEKKKNGSVNQPSYPCHSCWCHSDRCHSDRCHRYCCHKYHFHNNYPYTRDACVCGQRTKTCVVMVVKWRGWSSVGGGGRRDIKFVKRKSSLKMPLEANTE